jgi:hypothetical protein
MKKIILGLILFTLLMGCASMKTNTSHFEGIDDVLAQADYATALQRVEAAKDKGYTAKERVLYFLDAGMLNFYAGNHAKSNEYLEKAERAIEENYTKSISKGAASFLLNDNALEYAGEDYENIYLNVFKALNYLELGSFDGAFVEIRRIDEKLKLMDDKYSDLSSKMNQNENAKIKVEPAQLNFHNSALGRYLSLLIYRAEGKADDARIDLEKIKSAWQQQGHIYDFARPEMATVLQNNDKAKLNFLAFTGTSPYKKARTLYIHTFKNTLVIATSEQSGQGKSDLNTLDSFHWEDIIEDLHFKFQLPILKVRDSRVKEIRILVDGKRQGKLQLLESINNVAKATYKVKEPITYIKTITRTVVKGLASHKAKGEMDKNISNPLLAAAAKFATDMAVDATENADLRIARFFPAKAYIAEIELQPGTYNIELQFVGANNTVLFAEEYPETQISSGGLNLVESFYLQ